MKMRYGSEKGITYRLVLKAHWTTYASWSREHHEQLWNISSFRPREAGANSLKLRPYRDMDVKVSTKNMENTSDQKLHRLTVWWP